MPPISDTNAIRAQLSDDRAWAIYALGDLVPSLFQHTRWYATKGGTAILLLFSALETPVLFTMGAAAEIEPLLGEIGDQTKLYLSIQPDILPLIQARYHVTDETPMWRMVLDRARFTPKATTAARLTLADYSALTRLYADGEPAGETPDFFAPYMVEQGVFYGVYEGPDLVAAAGTHLVAPAEGVAAIGNVYTRRDRRGRGLAGEVTGAVVAELVRATPAPATAPGAGAGVPAEAVIALNVKQANVSAARIYERLGFERYCGYYEGLALPLV